jgi:hypothetical protein
MRAYQTLMWLAAAARGRIVRLDADAPVGIIELRGVLES